jgi:hypothetical protein
MKAKKALEKSEPVSNALDEEPSAPSPTPMFSPKATRTRALPSAFASLLIDDRLTYSEGKDNDPPKSTARGGRNKKMNGDTAFPIGDGSEKHTHRSRSQKIVLPSFVSDIPTHGFSFDVPSPDDVVLQARRGTSLAKRREMPSISSSSARSPALASTSRN